MGLSPITDYIILIAAVVTAITVISNAIFKYIIKPLGGYKKKELEKEEARMKAILDKLIPDYLIQHDYETRDKYLADRQRYLQEISTEVLSHTEEDLRIIKDLTREQSKIIDLLRKNTLDVLRQKIENIYYQYRGEKKFPLYIKENLEELFRDYTEGGGNHHIGKLYDRMQKWETYYEVPEYDKE